MQDPLIFHKVVLVEMEAVVIAEAFPQMEMLEDLQEETQNFLQQAQVVVAVAGLGLIIQQQQMEELEVRLLEMVAQEVVQKVQEAQETFQAEVAVEAVQHSIKIQALALVEQVHRAEYGYFTKVKPY
jgi:hypothetical protein